MTAPADDDEAEMEMETETEEPEGDQEDEEEPKRPKLNTKQLLIVAGMFLGILLLVGGTTAYFMGWMHDMLGIEQEKSIALIELGESVTHELPQIKADLKVGKCRSPFLRAHFTVQLSDRDLDRLESGQEKVMEQIILHLRDQERSDLVGKAGAEKIRFDIITIINNVIAPARIHGITFKEFVLQ